MINIVRSKIVWKFGDYFNADLIVPAKYRYEYDPDVLAKVCLADYDPEFPRKVTPGNIIIAGRSFGYGHPHPTGIHAFQKLGIGVLIAESFAPVWYRVAIAVAFPVLNCPDITRKADLGHLLEHADHNWVYLPGTDTSTLETAYQTNSFTYKVWTETTRTQTIGFHAESVVRGILHSKTFRQPKNPPTFFLHSAQGVIDVTPDAYTLTPFPAAFEVKNGLSDIWTDPTTIRQPSEDQQQILDHFEMCKQNQLRPAFIAPKVDPSFHDFASRYNGLVFELGFQILPPYSPFPTLKSTIATNLGFTNIVLAAEDPPYPPELTPFLAWLDSLKSLVAP